VKSTHKSVQNLMNQRVLAEKCTEAVSFMERLKGWMGVSMIEKGAAIWFPHCNSVHMWFMRVPLDIVFLKKTGPTAGAPTFEVSSLYSDVQPWKVLPLADWAATDVLEFPVGTIGNASLKKGDQICIS
jgi:uncharacterized protein